MGASRTDEGLGKRCSDLLAIKKNLDQSVLDVEAAIVTAERSLARAEKRVDPNDTAKKNKLMEDKAVLEDLKNTRAALKEEIRNKLAAIDVENLCRRVTPAKASEVKRMTRASSATSVGRKKEPQSLSSSAASMTLDYSGHGDAESLESTRASSSMKPSSPGPGASKTLRGAGALGLQAPPVG